MESLAKVRFYEVLFPVLCSLLRVPDFCKKSNDVLSRQTPYFKKGALSKEFENGNSLPTACSL
jgi:hypothetical protein